MATLHDAETTEQVIDLYNKGHGAKNYYSLYLTTPLHSACKRGNKKVIGALCSLNDNLNEFNFYKETALDEAVKYGDIIIVDYLLKQIIVKIPNFSTIIQNIYRMHNKVVNFNDSAVNYAKDLIYNYPYEVNKIVNLSSTIHYAVLYNNITIFDYLLRLKNDINEYKDVILPLSTRTISGTPLMIACYNKNYEIICKLLKNNQTFNIYDKLNINAINERDESALFSTIKNNFDFNNINHKNIIELLILNGANINHKNYKGKTILHKICKIYDCIELISFLITNGADVNAACTKGFTPLMIASKYKKYDTIFILINSGASTIAVNDLNMIASDYGDSIIKDMLNKCYF